MPTVYNTRYDQFCRIGQEILDYASDHIYKNKYHMVNHAKLPITSCKPGKMDVMPNSL